MAIGILCLWVSACQFVRRKKWYNTPVNLKGEIDAGEKDLRPRTSDLGQTLDTRLRTVAEVGSQILGVGGWQEVEVLSPMS